MRPSLLAILLLILVSALSLGAVLALPGEAAPGDDPGALRDRIDSARERERSLSADVARLGSLATGLERQVAVLERRRAEVQGDLDADGARLQAVQGRLRSERARLARLRRRLAEVRRTLAQRLVALYKAPRSDLTSIVLSSRSFADLVERAVFIRRVQRQDKRILLTVRSARADAQSQTRRLAVQEARQRSLVAALQARRNALASMSAAVAQRRASLLQVRAARAEALSATRAGRVRVQQRLRAVERELARATGGRGPGGPWAIPWPIVQCESGGQNLPPNSAGASGYYQIIPETWQRAGGRGPAAHLAPKAEQDRVAAALWNGGAGASAWVCAGLVGA